MFSRLTQLTAQVTTDLGALTQDLIKQTTNPNDADPNVGQANNSEIDSFQVDLKQANNSIVSLNDSLQQEKQQVTFFFFFSK